ncbi:MAG TPA: PKD domain-containing protein [Thermoanaerobaculia bacterium]|nr:PKD domain-containing protein [Thermoanaerobaculia bacterium]
MTPVCRTSDSIKFDVVGFAGYNFNCSSHTYLWTADGGQISTFKSFSTQLAAGTHNMSVTVTNGSGDSHPFPFVLTVASGTGGTPQPLPNPVPVPNPVPNPTPVPQPTGCGVMSGNTVSYDWFSAGKACSSIGATCGINQALTFDVGFFNGYDPTKCTHSYAWTLDGQTYTTKSFNKTFAQAGTYPGHLTVNNGSGVPFDLNFTVPITTTGPTPSPVTPDPSPNPTPIGQCGTMNNNTILVKYVGPTTGCNELGGNCETGEAVSFNVKDVHPGYDFSCGVHKFTWNFGDGTAPAVAGVAVSHPYTVTGNYPVTVKVEQGSSYFLAATAVHIVAGNGGSGGTPIANFDFSVSPYYIGDTRVPNGWVFTPFAEPTINNPVWNWNFNDGSTNRLQTSNDYRGVPHIFPDGNDYTITLTSPQSLEQHTHTLKIRRRPGR